MIKTNAGEFQSPKINTLDKIKSIVESIRNTGKKVGLCIGGYDLLHPGQMKHLESAKNLCDVLIIGVTADKFNSKRKGNGRPIYNEYLRAYSLSQMQAVDFVFISNFEKAVEAINILRPDYYIKGPDYINKQTPGITAERKAISNVNGEIKYTTDPKLSTTEIIGYIKDVVDKEKLLLILDRDGTLIEERDFLGKNDNWKEEILLNNEVLGYIKHLDNEFNATKIVVSNQTGVARKMFSEERVADINVYIDRLLRNENIIIDDWKFCPFADKGYADKNNCIEFDTKYVVENSGRKPGIKMVIDSLKHLNLKLEGFNNVMVLGDRVEDKVLSENLCAKFVGVKDNVIELKDFDQA